MNNLLKRYLKQIEKYLPLKDRKDTLKELESIILDQIDERVSDGEKLERATYNVIHDMGEPREVAVQYRNDNAMISREMEPVIMMIIKIISITLPLVLLFAYTLDYVFATDQINAMDYILEMVYKIPGIMLTVVTSYGFIFMIFVLIEKYVSPKFTIEDKEFYPELLPQVPTKQYEVSLIGSILAICFSILFLYIVNFQEGLIAIYYDGVREPLLNDNFSRILPLLNISIIIDVFINIYYVFRRRKNLASKTFEFVQGVFSGIVTILLATSNIFNDVIIEGHNLNFLPNTFKIVFIILGILTIIGKLVEYIKAFINLDEIEEVDKKIKEKRQA